MIFLTCNDAVNGIYEGQVLDVVRFLRSEFKLPVKLFAMFPGSYVEEGRGLLANADPGSMAFASRFPIRFYGWNSRLVHTMIDSEKTVWARGVLACELALRLKKRGKINKVIYDGRGAVAEEFREYISPSLFSTIARMEKRAVLNSDHRLAVSDALVHYWRTIYGYRGTDHVVIPTTLNSGLQLPDLNESLRSATREKLGFGPRDVVFVYSGGSAEWQSFALIGEFVRTVFKNNATYRLLLMVKGSMPDLGLPNELKDRVVLIERSHHEIPAVLSACDHGLLLRENSVTNKVASPTKFAEYLYSGLDVIISENVGDYTGLLKEKELGSIYSGMTIELNALTPERRKYLQDTAVHYFSKNSSRIREKYDQLVAFCNG